VSAAKLAAAALAAAGEGRMGLLGRLPLPVLEFGSTALMALM
jgi:hypothetical protein